MVKKQDLQKHNKLKHKNKEVSSCDCSKDQFHYLVSAESSMEMQSSKYLDKVIESTSLLDIPIYKVIY